MTRRFVRPVASSPVFADAFSPVLSGGGGAVVAPFAYETEAQTFFTAALGAGVEPTTARKRTYNRLIKRLKDYGVWTKLTHLWLLAADNETIAMINVKNPGSGNLTKVGTPTFTQNDGVNCTSGDTGNYYDTNVALNTISRNDHSFGVYSKTASSSTNNDFGGIDGSLNGITINTKHTTGGNLRIRSMGAFQDVGNPANTSGQGLFAVSRNNSSTVSGDRSGYRYTNPSNASAAISSTNTIHILRLNNPGSAGTGRKLSMAFLGTYLTETESRNLYGAVEQYQERVLYGEPYEEEVGIGTAEITADVIVYGATSSAATAAYEAARQGKTVAIVGGWRDRRVGGMSAGGLGFTDFDNKASLGGLPRWIITKMNAIYGRADTTFQFEPRQFSRAVNFLLDSSLNGGRNTPIYYTNGVVSVQKTGQRITSIRTADGRTFTGSQYIDCSYEGDLLAMAGVTMFVGREAAGSGMEAANGWRGISTASYSGSASQFSDASNNLLNIDPYVTPGVPASGLINGVTSTYVAGTPALGSADSQVQAYNYRLTLTTNAARVIPFPSTAPTGYNAADWEALGRWFAAYPAIPITRILKIDALSNSVALDVNNGPWSTDFFGASAAYPTATYAAREVIWKAHWNRILSLFYYLQYDPDSRIPAGIRTAALTYGIHDGHYPDHHENDDVFVSPQLYVREARKMVGSLVWNGNDLTATDGTTPRSTKTISTASYVMDSHFTEAIADPNAGTPRIWLTGGLAIAAGGVDLTSPIPYEIIVPNTGECENIFSTFAISATHVAFGSIRMEFTSMMMGQSAALAACQAIDDGVTVQNVNYTNLRTALLASPTLAGEVAPVLPQVN